LKAFSADLRLLLDRDEIHVAEEIGDSRPRGRRDRGKNEQRSEERCGNAVHGDWLNRAR
jgi:hypothetical protein